MDVLKIVDVAQIRRVPADKHGASCALPLRRLHAPIEEDDEIRPRVHEAERDGEMNRVGMNLMLWTVCPDIDEHGIYVEHLKHWGYDAFEIMVGELDARQIDGFAKKAAEAGMAAKAADLYPAEIADLIGPTSDERRRAVDRIKSSIHKARDLGSELLSGPIYEGLGRETSVERTTEQWKWAVEGLHECALEAQTCGIRIAAEPLNRFEMRIVNTIADAYRLCMEVGVPSMGILADTHHSNIEEPNLLLSYVSHADRIYQVHISTT